jgi:ABC-type multidrug transport system fused ATPase/permease subunit
MVDTFTTEESSSGTLGSFKLLWRFVKRVSFLRWAFLPNLLLALLASTGYQLFLWLSGRFAECSSNNSCQALTLPLGINLTPSLSAISCIAVCIYLTRTIQWNLFETGSQLAIRGLLKDMVHGVARARTTFFDEYPSGKIINRLVKDSDSLRLYAPIRIGDTVNSIVEVLVIAIAISFANKVAALFAVPVLLFFLYVQRNLAPMLQHLMVLRSARFGEVLHRESDVIEGVRDFALYNQLPALSKRLTDSVYRFMQMHFLRGRVEAWGRLLSDLSLAFYGAGIVICVHLASSSGALEPVLGAIIITASLRLGSAFAWLTWSLGQIFESAGHARRVFEYVDLPSEDSEEGNKPAKNLELNAPVAGDLTFSDYTMSYRSNTPLIINNLNLTIKRGSKVGIVGRTGSGKSSFVQALFRMVYVHSGDISIGSTSLLAMDLDRARGLFAVVPQDPYLFEDTLRSNLDRLGEHTDTELNAALQTVRLSLDLDTPMIEGGQNLSFGERQLICLARVILSNRPFVIMDEPTSGVDSITDAIMQAVLRTALRDRTVITIAHRIETLAKMDRIIELKDGRVLRDEGG